MRIQKLTMNLFLLIAAFIILSGSGCETNAPTATEPTLDVSPQIVLAKKGKHRTRGSLQFPIHASKVYKYSPAINGYRGGEIRFRDNRSKFVLADSALIPPPDIPWGDDVTITMTIDYDSTNGELQFTFDPHGCQFTKPAMIKLDYRVLNVDVPVLYYIDEDGNYIEMQPDDINVNKRWLKIWVHHFSRYALVYA